MRSPFLLRGAEDQALLEQEQITGHFLARPYMPQSIFPVNHDIHLDVNKQMTIKSGRVPLSLLLYKNYKSFIELHNVLKL